MRAMHIASDLQFPKPRDRHYNMMPFVLGDPSSLPVELEDYAELACSVAQDEHGLIGFLTVDEREVPAGESHRRGGLHIEAPGLSSWGGGGTGWGGGRTVQEHRYGGIYMASTLPACKIYPDFRVWPGDERNNGDCEHLREKVGDGQLIAANEMWWMTDHCLHESVPLAEGGYRQFLRVVTNDVGVWYSQHSTANPLGIVPNCVVSHVNKFANVA